MNLTPILISMVIASGIALGVYPYYRDVNTAYAPDANVTAPGEFMQFNQTFGAVNIFTSAIQDKITNIQDKGLVSLYGFYDMGMIFLYAIGLIAASPTIILGFISTAVGEIPGVGGANGWVIGMMTTIIVVLIVSLLVSLVLKRFGSEI